MKKRTNKTALVLSGGGARGGYEVGVWQALAKLRIPIHIAVGTSVGAINGAMVAQNQRRLTMKLWETLETNMIFDLNTDSEADAPDMSTKKSNLSIGGIPPREALAYAREIITKGGAGHTGLESLLKEYIDEDKVRKSPVSYGLVTVEFPSMKPHYLFMEDIPRGKLLDYILASASCFPAVQIMKIDGKRFVDGGYADVMPVEMAVKKGARRIIAVDLQAAGFQRPGTLKEAKEMTDEFILIKSNWDLGNFLVFDKNNTRRMIRLGYLDTMKAFGKLEGKKYSFKKNTVPPQELSSADKAAEYFELDPTQIYKKKTLLQQLKQALQAVPGLELGEFPSPEELSGLLHKSALVLFIAKDLKEKEGESFFLGKKILHLLKDEVLAANFLLKNGLI